MQGNQEMPGNRQTMPLPLPLLLPLPLILASRQAAFVRSEE
jgi:hypothetical protein